MTNVNPSNSRLDRLETLSETVLLAIQQQNTQLSELRETVTQQGEYMQQNIADVVRMVGSLAQQQTELTQQHAESDQRFENLLQDARADRQRLDQALEDAKADRQRIDQALENAKADRQRIDQAIAKGDRDRAINENEHRAFRETFQTLLAEVARIWQRLAG